MHEPAPPCRLCHVDFDTKVDYFQFSTTANHNQHHLLSSTAIWPQSPAYSATIFSIREDHPLRVESTKAIMSDAADSPVARQANDDFDDAHQDAGHQSDRDSDNLSEIDEDQFDDYDPNNEDKPIDIDENVALTLKAAKRKRVDTEAPKKPKEGRRPTKRARAAEADVKMGDGGGGQARRPRKSRTDGEERRAARKEAAATTQEQENEENLTPEERKRRALDRAIDEAVKGGKNKRRRKKDDIVGDR